jgi:phosphatidylethanolamine/phosphatidyl-N-methylethanolamine N-methyltransferase
MMLKLPSIPFSQYWKDYASLWNIRLKDMKLLWEQNSQDPDIVGAFFPSSQSMNQMITKKIKQRDKGGYVVELGSGTGPLLTCLEKNDFPLERCIGIEYETSFVNILRQKFPKACIIQGDASRLPELLPSYVYGSIDTLYSSIPFAVLSWPKRFQIVQAILKILEDDLMFYQITYIPSPSLDPKYFNFLPILEAVALKCLPPTYLWSFHWPKK